MPSQLQKGLGNLITNHKTGLCIVSLPTGSGKSYSVKNILFDALMDRENERKYVCITSARKNKLYKELSDLCKDPESKGLFDEYVIDVKANGDMVQDNFKTIDTTKISDPELKKKYDKLYTEIQKDELLKNSGSNIYVDNRKGIEIAEREFRKEAHRYLKEKYRSYSKANTMEFLNEESNEDNWLVKLFPGILIKKKKIIFMTVAKFVYPYDSILETPFYFYDDKDFKDGVFYIDEFDQAKKSMLDQIINRDINSFDGKIDLLGMFNNVLQSLSRGIDNLPREFFMASDLEKKRGYDEQELRGLFERLEKSAKEISDEYHLAYEVKTKESDEENNSFLFHDSTVTIPIGKQNRGAYVETNREEKTNFIHKTGNFDLRLETVLKRIEGYLRYFVRACYAYAINIRENQIQKGNNFYELSDAISSVTSALRISEPYNEFIHKQVLYGGFGQKRNTVENINDNFYEVGFNLFSIEDSNSHSMNSIIKMEVHEDTPEKIILKMSRQGLTIGLSATGDIETCIENFDLSFLAAELKDDYLSIDPTDLKLIEEEYASSVEKQAGLYQIRFTDQYTKETELDCYKSIFEELNVEDEYVEEFIEDIKNNVSEFEIRKHIYNLLWAFDQFLFNDDISSYLCLLNTYLNLNKKNDFVKGLINELINQYVQAGNTQYLGKTYDDLFAVLDSENFEQKKKKILEELNKGHKLFVLSCFPALATGQNLQYKTPEYLINSGQLITTNDRTNEDNEKDFDGVFVEKPSNILVNLSKQSDLTAESKVEAMYQAEELRETGEISKTTMLRVLNRVAGSGSNYENLYEKDSIRNAEAITIIQSIGRIDRTNIKNIHVYINAEYDVINSFSFKLMNSPRMVAPAVKELYSIIAARKTKDEEPENNNVLLNRAVNKADYLGNNIYNLMNNGTWTADSIKDWESLNENLLVDPQAVSINKDSNLFIDLPKESNRYYYRQTGDFRNNEIFFDAPVFDTECQEVSEKGTRLDILMNFTELRRLFEEKSYATSFVPSKRMMAPVIANNLLKGRYGEIVGKYLLEKYAGIKLEKITDSKLYEKFDFQINNFKVVIDFKNWSERTRFDNKFYTEKMIQKAKECGAELVLAINLISEENYKPYEQVVDGISIKEIPNLIIRRGDRYEINYDVITKIGEIIRGYM